MALLAIRDLCIDYRQSGHRLRAVDRASLMVPQGSITGVVGESGSGKTTLGRAVIGVQAANASIASGEIIFAGRDLLSLAAENQRQMRWREIAFVPQTAMNSLDPVYRVGDQLMAILTRRGGLERDAALARSRELFAAVGLAPERLRDYPHQFSGGMRQRAAIAMALALRPKLIVADEPVTALDVLIQKQILDLLMELRASLGLSLIIITHDIGVVSQACDRVVVMYGGQVVEEGRVDDVLLHPAHPYTMGLLQAFPDLADGPRDLVPIPGIPPDLAHPPEGCRFAPRCPFARADCTLPLDNVPVSAGHLSACRRAHEASTLRELAKESRLWAS